jgi:uncharacterized membrane protein
MSFEHSMDDIARGVEILGVATLLIGLVAALLSGGLELIRGQAPRSAYRTVRTIFAHAILLGLEFLVAADIIRTVAVQPSLENVAVLGLIVLIRTFLSFSLEVELEGRWPWAGGAAPAPAELGQSGRRTPTSTRKR